jgi:cytochrome c oxidase assembly protein subunit 11
VLHWEGAVTVHLTAAVHPDLPWEFYPQKSEIQAMPGETVRVNYFARNTSNQTITGKAVHEILPLEYRSYFETVQCFCFTEQTLGPGEVKEMPLVFRVDFTVPQGVTEFTNAYTFYTLESFPESGAGQ